MRTVHLLRKCDPAEWGGTETAIQRLCVGLRRHEVEVVVYCPQPERSPGEAGGESVPHPLAASGATVRHFRAFVPVCGISAAERRRLVAVGGNLMSWGLGRGLRQEPECAVLHTHSLGRLGGIAAAVARRRSIPLVVTIHGGLLDLPAALKASFQRGTRRGFEWGKVFGWCLRSRQLLEQSSAILTCNPREAALLQARHPDRLIQVQPHGVPTEDYALDRRAAALAAFPRLAGREVVLAVGRVDPVKNQLWLVEQLPALRRRHPTALLVLAGPATDATYRQSLEARIQALGLADHVCLTGGLPPGDPRLVGLLQTARVLVLPSLSETFGLVILEAWAAGTAVLCSRTSGALALVRERENGWLFDVAEPHQFHAALDEVLRVPEVARGLAAAGGRLVRAEYDTTVLAGRLKRLYTQLTEERHALRPAA